MSENQTVSEREQVLEQKILDFEKQLAFFKSCVTLVQVDETQTVSQKGKGKGKKSKKTDSSIFQRLRQGLTGNDDAVSITSAHSLASASESPSTSQCSGKSRPPPYSEQAATTKTVFVKQVQLLLNGAPLDQIETTETKDDCIFTYWKMFQNGGFASTLTTNSISYDDFK